MFLVSIERKETKWCLSLQEFLDLPGNEQFLDSDEPSEDTVRWIAVIRDAEKWGE